jgi:hypothetical protein
MHNYCVDEIANRLFPGTPVECLKEEIINAVVELTRRMNAASYETTDCMKSQDAKPEDANIAKDCQKCRSESLEKLQCILGEYFLGPEERAEILERVR